MVYECHVDSNPVQGMLYTATLSERDGGALVVGLDPSAQSIEEVDANCQELYPKANKLLLFDARRNPHYVRPMTEGHARVAVAMNFYTDESPESARPADLSRHLFGRE
ncbi:2OG-Fe(II) oxygenase [Jatrophihabitans sp.]|uniref:2OG-Fe(II) oxygenase n=1 Tax=Jatrophihabitans sp. TaxID=1932789 RepID=UPI0038CD95A6